MTFCRSRGLRQNSGTHALQRLRVPAGLPAGRDRHLPPGRSASAAGGSAFSSCCRSSSTATGTRRSSSCWSCRSRSTGWPRAPIWRPRRSAIITARHRRQSGRARVLQIRQFRFRQSRLLLDRPLLAFQYRAAARHLVLHLPSHHVSGRSAAREGAGLFARPLRALHLVLPAGDRRPAGALVGGHAPVRPRGLRAGLAAPVRHRLHLHRHRADREDLARRSASAACSIRSTRRPGSAR